MIIRNFRNYLMKSNYILTESLVSTISIYLILKKLMTNFDQWDAYKLGIIDNNGNKLKHPITSKEREAWDILTRFCWNLKKLSYKFIGKSKFATYFTSAYLIKDSINPYIKYNQPKIETMLSEMTYTKQNVIYEAIKTLPINENIDLDDIELAIFKYIDIVESTIDLDHVKCCLFEDGAEGSVASDIAQASQYLGMERRKKKKVKLVNLNKKENENESN